MKGFTSHPIKAIWASSLTGLKANLVPGLVLQAIGLAIVLVYYQVNDAHVVFDGIASLKQHYSYLYSGISTAIFGGIIPFAYLYWAKLIPKDRAVTIALFYILYWTWRGMEVDAFYRLQDWLFGDGIDWHTIAIKVAVDQFIYCPFWSAPVTAIFFGWKDQGFSWRSFKSQINRRLFTFVTPSILLAVWIVWIPGTAIIYSLPLALQIPLFNLTLCFFVLLVSVLGNRPRGASGTADS